MIQKLLNSLLVTALFVALGTTVALPVRDMEENDVQFKQDIMKYFDNVEKMSVPTCKFTAVTVIC